jgi:hypothetical protein
VNAGDQIYASVDYLGGGNYFMALADTTQGWHWSMPLSIRSHEVPTTAEWVVEAGTYTLANFGHVTFTDASYSTATTQGILLGGNGSVTPQPLEVAVDGTPLTGVTTVSPPGLFSITYVGPKLPVFP